MISSGEPIAVSIIATLTLHLLDALHTNGSRQRSYPPSVSLLDRQLRNPVIFMFIPHQRILAKLFGQFGKKMVIWNLPSLRTVTTLKCCKHLGWNIGRGWRIPALKLEANNVSVIFEFCANNGDVVCHRGVGGGILNSGANSICSPTGISESHFSGRGRWR